MTKHFIYLIVLSCVSVLFAQQEQQYSQFAINPFTFNPAIAGTEEFIDLQAGIRQQWSGFSGAPTTAYISVHGTIGKAPHQYHYKGEHRNWHGVGMQYFNDQTGAVDRNAFLFAYAYNMSLSKKLRLSVGSYLGVKSIKVDHAYWKNIEDNDDDLFARSLQSGYQPDMHLGALLYTNRFFASFSAANLIGQNFELSQLSNSKNWQHYYVSTGVKLDLNYSTTITPMLISRFSVNAPPSIDLAAKVSHNNRLWYGASLRMLEALNLFAGININKVFDLSYAFEWSFSRLRNYNSGTHELIIGLRLNHGKNITCPSKYW